MHKYHVLMVSKYVIFNYNHLYFMCYMINNYGSSVDISHIDKTTLSYSILSIYTMIRAFHMFALKYIYKLFEI